MIFILRKRLQTTVSSKYKRKKTRVKYRKTGLRAGVIISAVALFVVLVCVVWSVVRRDQAEKEVEKPIELPPIELNVQLLDVNEYSRPGLPLKKVKGIVVHYTANPGTDAMANRNYFNNLPRINEKKSQKTYVSSHFVIGLEGEIVQCIPTAEMAYASNNRNSDTVSIECCHKNRNGKFTTETYESLVKLTTYLCVKFDLTEEDLLRHFDITGKNCPKYFVENQDKWDDFKRRVGEEIRNYKS
nr:N-acetylmuramoyl-L-alanine amidase [Eubacterium sp.]